MNFDVDDALRRLKAEGIVNELPDGTLQALPPREAALHIDKLWDACLDNLPDSRRGGGLGDRGRCRSHACALTVDMRYREPRTASMFQTYDAPEGEQDLAARTARLRGLMAKTGLDAVLVPRADEHQGEYVAPSAERLKWLTGFSGSAGLAVVARSAAALFVDGRYIAQAPTQVDTRIFEVLQIPDAKLSDWLGKHLRAGAVVGFDPWLHTATAIEDLGKSLEPKKHQAQGAVQEPRGPHLGARASGAAAGSRHAPPDDDMPASRLIRRSPSCKPCCARRARTRSF